MFARGHIPDHPAVEARRAGLHLHPQIGAMRAGTLPLMTTNRAFLSAAKGGPGILNQNDTGSCEGHAHASGTTLFFAILLRALVAVVSPVGLYYGALMDDRKQNNNGTLPRLFDTGTMPSAILAGMQRWGGCAADVWGQYPASSGTLYEDPSNPNSPLIEPTPNQLYAERAFRLNGAYFVLTNGHQKLVDLMTALAAGYPVSDAIPASGPEFQGYAGGILGTLSGPIDHANLIVDYTWIGTAEQFASFLAGDDSLALQYLVFHCVNSWGDGWGEVDSIAGVLGGMYRANTNYVQQASSLCVLDLARAP